MRNGIIAAPLPAAAPFAKEINAACAVSDWFPYVVSAIQNNETSHMPDAATVISADGGHGVMQLTSAYPPNWTDPYANILYAIDNFLEPAETYWATEFEGDDLIRAIAAEYNAGRRAAIAGHEAGDLDKFTTDRYADRALATYLKLLVGEAV